MLVASVLYIGFIVLTTGCGLYLGRVGTNSGHLVASAAGVFGCVLVAAAATITLSLSDALGSM